MADEDDENAARYIRTSVDAFEGNYFAISVKDGQRFDLLQVFLCRYFVIRIQVPRELDWAAIVIRMAWD